MLKKITDLLEGIPATVISGIFLLMELIPHILENFGINAHFLPFNPAVITVVISGVPIIYSAVKKLINKKGISKISSSLLISIAMTSAVIIGDIFAAGEVAFIMAIGEILEHITVKKAKKGLKKLVLSSPVTGRKMINGKELTVSAEEIKVGDRLRILPGEAIPADGVITVGETSVNEALITGEALPIDKAVGDRVLGGTVNCHGSIDIIAEKTAENSTLNKLIELMKTAENNKAPMEKIADKWASILVPAALIAAVILGIIKKDITIAVTVLVVFCPCALVLATPTAIMAAIGNAAKRGVIIKSGDALQRLSEVDTVAFDKTGTLTKAELNVSDIIPFNGISKSDLLRITASAELKSEHPIGRAIVSHAKSEGLSLSEPSIFEMKAGRGISADILGEHIICGNVANMHNNGICICDEALTATEAVTLGGGTFILVTKNNELCGIITLRDTVKENAISAVSRLNTDVYLLSGDNINSAKYVAEKVGIKDTYANLLPEEKVKIIKELSLDGKKICMVGDGINDAPALKTAYVGISMATLGSDISVEASDVAILGDDINKIPYLLKLSTLTVKTIKFCISLSLIINFVGIILSYVGLLNPLTGALVHNLGSVLVILISALLYELKIK